MVAAGWEEERVRQRGHGQINWAGALETQVVQLCLGIRIPQ